MKVDKLREHATELGFTPQDQVRWLAPAELARTAVKVGLSSVFADYADRREVQAALPMPPITVRRDDDNGLWLDFVADLGDGFDSTYTVASLLAQPQLDVDPPDVNAAASASASASGRASSGVRLPRGSVLVFGGDEIYPTPSATGYEDRTKGPYRAALPPETLPLAQRPLLLALPGNHDWYDGLTAFLRVFAQRRPFGGWRTEQTRSYFAVNLADGWWLAGVDTQLGTYIDGPQIDYFREHLSGLLQPGDAVILCAPTPTWIHTAQGNPDAFNSLRWFEENVVQTHTEPDGSERPTHADVRMWVTGDMHHYARYAEDLPTAQGPVDGDARQMLTCGLGGSFLTETHRLPEKLLIPSPQSRMLPKTASTPFSLAARYPAAQLCRSLVPRVLSLGPYGAPMRNPGLWRLCGVLQALLVLMFTGILGAQWGSDPVSALRAAGALDVVHLFGQALLWFVVVLLVASFVPVVRGGPPRTPSEAFLAIGLQLLVSFAALAALVALTWPNGWPSWLVLSLAMLATVLIAGLVSSYAFALYLLASGTHIVQSWQMSAQAVEDYKGFLRMRFAPDGSVTVYPLVVDKVCHDWELDGTRPVPVGGLPRMRLAEPPIRVNRTRSVPSITLPPAPATVTAMQAGSVPVAPSAPPHA